VIEFPAYYRPFMQPCRFKGLYGGRGSGKSHCFAGHLVMKAATIQGFRAVCVREVQISIKDSVKQLIEDKIREFGLGGFFTTTETEIVGRNDSRIIFRGMQNHTAASIKSLEGYDLAWIEEAQTISARSLELLTPTIRKPGSEIWASWNPENENDPIDQFFRGQESPDILHRQANWDENPWFPEELRRDMERDKDRDPDKWLHVWQGHYRSLSEARIFRNWRVAEMEPPPRVVWFYGVDFGFAKDPTAAIRCCLIGDRTLYIDHEAWEVGVPTEALPALLHRVPDIHRWASIADSARPETIDYLRRNGFPKMRPARKGKGSVEDGISFLQGLDIVIHPRCANMAREMGSYAYRTDKRTGQILPVPDEGNEHLIDAVRYATERLHRKGKMLAEPVTEPMPLPKDYVMAHDDEEGSTWRTI
jgi:phage terminase large subunit